jgi:hypothetical protein
MAEFWRSSVTAENAPVALLDGRTTSDGFGSACDGGFGSAGDGGFGSAGKCFARCGMIYVINLNLRLDVHFKTQKSYLHV